MRLLYPVLTGITFGMLGAIRTEALPRPQALPLEKGAVISRSGKIAPGVYELASEDNEGKTGAITVRGDNLTVDFAGAELCGTALTAPPDERRGTGVVVEGRNITLKHLRVRGYKIGLIARHSPGLKILDSDFSYNWKQHLRSTLEREDLEDWMSYHHNEAEEWLRYGAGVYLQDCDGFEARGNTIQGGQCGLMLARCNKGLVWNNNFSFLSGLGVGMYRSSENRVFHNKVDWCVRGYSHGVYNRGQDSAGILVFEQCNKNVFAYNSVTHGGDGFFLWAGQHTMDTGSGGCNDNLLYGNDFSHAPTNGIEVTFSRNTIINNRVEECDNGIWGGYSYDTQILNNHFARNNRAVAIEHGQRNTLRNNVFQKDGQAIALWQNKTQDPNWGYPKHHDTVSHDYTIEGNSILLPQKTGVSLQDTRDVVFTHNTIGSNVPALTLAGDTSGWREQENVLMGPEGVFRPFTNTRGLTVTTLTLEDNLWSPDMQGRELLESAPRGQGLRPSDWQPMLKVAKSKPTPDAGEALKYEPKPMKGGQDAFLKLGLNQGRQYILVDEWGPYDFQSPRLWPRGKTPARAGANGATRYQFDVLGPSGMWRVKSARGVARWSAQSGSVPGTLDVELEPGKAVDLRMELEYTGAATTDYRGIATPAGTPVTFAYSKFFAPIDWNVRFFAYDPKTQEPRTQTEAFANLIATGKPVASLKTNQLDFAGYGAFAKGVPANYFATIAEGALEVPSGEYTLEVTTDDGCRVLLDGKTILNEWHYQGPTTYNVDLKLSGKHTLHVEHFQIDGYATLKVNLRPKR